MKPKSQRLIILFFFISLLSLSTFLVLKSLEDNIVYFYSPTDINKKILSNNIDLSKKIRIGGLVKENSILKEGKKISFKIHDGIDEILVTYNGILPDLFREKQGIVALGKIENKNFSAIEILAKHDENYMPKEVSDMLKKNGKWKGK
ncbi:MAG: cytochrome c maturation protein CcmE [Alphaproteobacteria bacterium]|nr:MAG: cytochrome c maturation protein CcmE [Alphaproteobacteria bacterium]